MKKEKTNHETKWENCRPKDEQTYWMIIFDLFSHLNFVFWIEYFADNEICWGERNVQYLFTKAIAALDANLSQKWHVFPLRKKNIKFSTEIGLN